MSLSKRATVYFDPEIHKALKMKAVETSSSISVLLDKLIRQEFLEDKEDLQIFNDRAAEPSITYEKLISDLKKSGKI